MAAIQHDWSSFKIFRFKISLGLKTFKTVGFEIFEVQNSRLEDCHALRGRTSAILHEFQGFQRLKDFKDARIPLEKGQLDSCKSRNKFYMSGVQNEIRKESGI